MPWTAMHANLIKFQLQQTDFVFDLRNAKDQLIHADQRNKILFKI